MRPRLPFNQAGVGQYGSEEEIAGDRLKTGGR
jgi:hypothetical protein